MNFCHNNIYFILIFLILGYLLYKDLTKKEGFNSLSDANKDDIEAIRNLSSIATQLTTNGGLIVPGKLQITDSINLGDPLKMSGTPNMDVKASGKMLLFDNTFDNPAGQGIPANKIRLCNIDNIWIGGFGLENGGVTYNSGDSHRFYVKTGPGYGNLAMTIDSRNDINITGNLKIGSWTIIDNKDNGRLEFIKDGIIKGYFI